MKLVEKNKEYLFSFYGPAIYQIKLKGKLDGDKSNILAGMQVTNENKEGGESYSTLIGQLKDQSALSGILNTLYEMRFPVISVKLLKDCNGD